MKRRHTGAASAIGLVAAVALTASACGSGTSTDQAKGFRISTIAASTEAAGTARFAGTSQRTFPGEGGPQRADFEGEADFAHDRASGTWRSHQTDGTVDESRSVTIGADLYFESPDFPHDPSFPDETTPTRPWTKTRSFSELSTPSGADVGNVAGLLAHLEDRGATAEKLGTELVRGVDTVHYRFTFPRRELPAQVEAGGMVTSPMQTWEVWADGENRLRRIEQRSDDGKDFSSTEWFDFGVPVSIEAPPASEVEEESRTELTGDWIEAQHGRTDNVAWTVYRAPSTDGSICVSHEADPPGPFDRDLFVQEGHSIDACSMPDEVDGFVGDKFETSTRPLADGRALLFGTAPPPIEALVLHYRGGRTERLVPSNGAFAVVLEADEVIEQVDPQAPDTDVQCQLDPALHGYNCSGTVGPQYPPGEIPVPSP